MSHISEGAEHLVKGLCEGAKTMMLLLLVMSLSLLGAICFIVCLLNS